MTAANGSDPAPESGTPAIQLQPTPPTPTVTITSESAKPTLRELDRAAKLAREIRTLDRILVVLTLALAFFLASFRATNSDVWMHLASGRMIANGQYPFWQAVDPFSHTSEGWDNHAWLSDLILYGVAQAFGGPESGAGGAALVVLKALLVTALAGVLLLLRRPSQGFWLPAVCTSLALLAMSPRLYLQTTIVSMLFLGITLLLLQRPEALRPAELAALPGWRRWLASTQRRFALPVLFALWVNLDGWYLLGPVTVALYLLGEFAQDRFSRVHGGADSLELGELKQLCIVTAAGFAACLISPYHIRGLALPPELATFLSDSMLREDGWFDSFFYASFDERHLTPANLELYQNVAVLSFPVLLVLGVGSFLGNMRGWRWWRMAVFVPFALLAVMWTRAVPFFAVVAAPIMALNFQDMAVALAARGTLPANRGLIYRLGTALTLAVLLGLAWPGLLHPRPDDIRSSRRVCWSLTTHESFRRAALALADLRQRGVLQPESCAFNLAPDAANLCAWYCPEEKTYFDLRMSPFSDKVTSDYVRARAELDYRELKSAGPRPAGRERSLPVDTVFPSVFTADKNHPVDHVIVTAQEWNSLRRTMAYRFWSDAKQWTLLYGDGRTMIFGWNDPRRPGSRFAAAEFDPVPDAFGPNVAPEPAESELDLITRPASAATDPASSQDWWTWYTRGPDAKSLATDESAMLHDAFTVRYQRREATLEMAKGLATSHLTLACFATDANFAGGISRLTEVPRMKSFPRLPVPADLSALLLLSVRAARTAVKESPDDPQAYYNLAVAIDLLSRQQAEMGGGRNVPLLEDIRQAQMVNALNRAVLLKPDFADAHHQLARLYFDPADPYRVVRTRMLGSLHTHLESHLIHLGRWMELSREELQRSPAPEGRQKQFEDEVRKSMIYAASAVQSLAKVTLTEDERRDPDALVRRLRTAYALKSENQPAHLRMGMALQFGLSEQAMEIARQVSPADLEGLPRGAGDQQRYLIFLLHIKSGYAHVAQEAESSIREPQLFLLLTAVSGDYRHAEDHLADLTARYEHAERALMLSQLRSAFTKIHADPQNLFSMTQLARVKADECDTRVIRGLMALENGDPTAAGKHLDTALRTTLSPMQMPKLIGLFGAGSPVEEIAYINAAQGVPERRFGFELAPLAAAYRRHLQEAARHERK